jgi:glycosyltransferase involved in cell wall biosynthesis
MRIAIFTETFLPKWDGIANTLCYLLDHLADREHQSLMFAPEGAPAHYANTRIVGLPSFTFPLYRDLKLVPPLVSVANELAAFRPDVVHLVNLASLGVVGMRHARELGVPVVASYHTDMPAYVRLYGMGLLESTVWAYFRWLHNQADLTLCPSSYTKKQIERHGFERVAVWGRGVDTQRFAPGQADAAWRRRLSGGQPSRTLLLYVGRLATEKRIDWIRPVLDMLPDVALGVVGDGPLRAELEDTFRGTPTHFTGYLGGEELAQAYASADLFVFPSPSETFGNVVLEAMASGLPVVAAGAGGPVDHVQHGDNGFLSDPEDPADFAALVWRCVSDVDARRSMAQTARAYAETQTWQRILDGLLAHYANLAEDGISPDARHTLGNRLRMRQSEHIVAGIH